MLAMNLSRLKRWIILLTSACFFHTCLAQEQTQQISNVDLCALIAHPGQFNQKRVRVRAQVESAVIEGGTWLEDASCKAGGVELSVPDSIRNHPEEHPDFKALDDAIRLEGNIGTVGKKVTATFTGEFARHFKSPKRVLVLEKVENLDVKIEKREHCKYVYDAGCPQPFALFVKGWATALPALWDFDTSSTRRPALVRHTQARLWLE